MKHGPRCEGCRVSMLLEGEEFVCPECGAAESARVVADDLTARPAPVKIPAQHGESKGAAQWFEIMRRAAE